MTMQGGGLSIDWALADPYIEHPTRELIVEALRWIGPLSAPDLTGLIDAPGHNLAYVAYHLTALVGGKVLTEIEDGPAGPSVGNLYFLAPSK
jgi:hypothetical protein